MGDIVPVEITVYEDRSYDFITKTSACLELIKKFAKITKGSSKPLTDKIGSITEEQLKEIAQTKDA